MPKKQYAAPDFYERKLEKVMERLNIDFADQRKQKRDYNYNFDRFGCYVEFRYKGELYRFDHSVEKAKARGVKLTYGSDAFAQVVMAIEDLARMVERGIYELQTWVAGMKFLPAPVEVPTFFRFLGFEQIPADREEVRTRFKMLAKEMHPDVGGDEEDFRTLKSCSEKALAYFGKE